MRNNTFFADDGTIRSCKHIRRGFLYFLNRIRHTQSVGRQNATVPMNKDTSHTQRLGHGTGMLWTSSTKARKGVSCNVVSFHLRQVPNGSAHGFVGNLQEPKRKFFHSSPLRFWRSIQKFFKGGTGPVYIQRFIFIGAKDMWKFLRKDPSQHQVGIRDCQVSVLAITDGTRMSSTRFWSNDKHAPFQKQPRTATRCHCLNVQLWCLDRHSINRCLQNMFQMTVVSRDVC
mmetsp:Transcript_48855/g.72924  ORF Transcript_48855/g.72924 Transcript_48855/m.72924 type:complete len:229 (-) Transcript_48855:1097-1783(-)